MVDSQESERVERLPRSAEEAEELELTAGGHWTTLKDWPHVQMRAASSPGKIMSINQIDEGMRARFG